MVSSAEHGDDVHKELERRGTSITISVWYERGAHHIPILIYRVRTLRQH